MGTWTAGADLACNDRPLGAIATIGQSWNGLRSRVALGATAQVNG
jgi:hypothetical protein